MILQYGSLPAWNYTEAETIKVSCVDLRGLKGKVYSELRNADKNNGTNEVLNAIGKQMCVCTKRISFDLFLGEEDFEDLDEVWVVELIRSENPAVLVLPNRNFGAYLLNDSGKTVQKIK